MRIFRVGGSAADAPAVTSEALAAARAAIAAGGTLIFPTDTVYGIGCAPEDERAIDSIFAAKHRPPQKPLAIHLADKADAGAYAARLTPGARAIIECFWPGPVSVIVERAAHRFSAAARGGQTIALRCPDDALCRAIVRATGPLAATSANVSGAPAFAGGDNLAALPEADVAIIAGPTKLGRESTVLDCSADVVRVVRAGALDLAVIAQALAGIAAYEAPPQ